MNHLRIHAKRSDDKDGKRRYLTERWRTLRALDSSPLCCAGLDECNVHEAVDQNSLIIGSPTEGECDK